VEQGVSEQASRSDLVGRIGWLANRLASMSPSEIAFRMGEQVKREVSRRHRPNFAAMLAGAIDDIPRLPGLADGLADIADDGLRGQWRHLTEEMAQGRYVALGVTWPGQPGLPDWHLDPVTGRRWPNDVYCYDIAYRHNAEMGDVKYVWELNRLQYLQPMAALAALDDDDDLAIEVVRHLESWLAANPPYQGINWSSGIELALRVVSLLVVSSLIGQRAFGEAFQHRLHQTLAAHGFWLHRYPSRFSSANNHLITEGGALYLLGRLVPALRSAGRWAAEGKRILERELLRQFHDDGVGAEQSPTYAAFSLEWLLLCAVVGERTGYPWSETAWRRIGKAGQCLRAMTDANGNQPRIGDDDEGRVLCSDLETGAYVNTIMGCIALATKKPDLAPPVVSPHLAHAAFGRPDPAARPGFEFRHFDQGGYTAVREWCGGEECLWVIDHGPLGYLSIAAHGHADSLAVWLHLNGRPVLVDGGTYLYHSGADWREHFRGTIAHNTLSIGGANSSITSGPFNWSHKAECRVLRLRERPEDWLIEAEHDGFFERYGFRHRRRLERAAAGSVQIVDSLYGSGSEVPVEIGFLLAPDLTVTNTSTGWMVADAQRRLLTISHRGPLQSWVESGLDKPKRGWHSQAFGQKVAVQRLVFAGKMGAEQSAAFALATRFD
jgi:hypothetical protein